MRKGSEEQIEMGVGKRDKTGEHKQWVSKSSEWAGGNGWGWAVGEPEVHRSMECCLTTSLSPSWSFHEAFIRADRGHTTVYSVTTVITSVNKPIYLRNYLVITIYDRKFGPCLNSKPVVEIFLWRMPNEKKVGHGLGENDGNGNRVGLN